MKLYVVTETTTAIVLAEDEKDAKDIARRLVVEDPVRVAVELVEGQLLPDGWTVDDGVYHEALPGDVTVERAIRFIEEGEW